MNSYYITVKEVAICLLVIVGPMSAEASASTLGIAVAGCSIPLGDRASCESVARHVDYSYDGPVGFTPADLLNAYELPSQYVGAGSPPIIGVIGAFDAPTMQSDLNYYSRKMSIQPLPTCKGAIARSKRPCFQKVDQRGGQDFSRRTDWSDAISIEVEAAHAICQNCSILLVEADDNYSSNLFPATAEGAALGARFVNVGYVIFAQESKEYYQFNDPTFDVPGVLFAAPEPAEGYNYFTYPATSKYVTAVGATSLYVNATGSYKSESAYSSSTSYCDKAEGKPDWQTGPKCKKRIGADLAMDGDIATGFAMYDSTKDDNGQSGWYLAGGSGLSASLVAATFALANHNQKQMPALPYQNRSRGNFHDITQGSNGTCNIGYFCNAKKGYDGPSGLGSPKGIGGF